MDSLCSKLVSYFDEGRSSNKHVAASLSAMYLKPPGQVELLMVVL